MDAYANASYYVEYLDLDKEYIVSSRRITSVIISELSM